MSKLSFFLLFIILSFSMFSAVLTQLTAAEKLYNEKDYSGAIKILNEIEVKKPHYLVYYNLGLCYWQLNDYYSARKYFLKSFFLNNNNQELRLMLNLLDQKMNLQSNYEFLAGSNPIWQSIKLVFSGTVLCSLILITFYLLNFFIFLLLKWKKRVHKTIALLLILFLLQLIIGLIEFREQVVLKKALIREESRLFSGPGKSEVELDTVRRGMALRVIQYHREWAQVLVENRYAGWILKTKIEEL